MSSVFIKIFESILYSAPAHCAYNAQYRAALAALFVARVFMSIGTQKETASQRGCTAV